MKRKIDIALDAMEKLLMKLIENPKEFDKLPKKSLLLPKENIIIPYKKEKTVGEFLVLPKNYSLEKLKKEFLDKK